MFRLGVLLHGSDPEAARGWWEKAAEVGQAEAMYNLGVVLKDTDPAAARDWYEKAAEAGVRRSHAQPRRHA